MKILHSLPESPHLLQVLQKFPKGVLPLLEFHDEILRGESALSIGEREMIAAYVSGLNACAFCFGSHKMIAGAFGVEEAVFDRLMEDVQTAPVPDGLTPMLLYAKKLTLEPAKMTPADADAVREAGWDEEALVDVVKVCALFNFMNRIIFGTGVQPQPAPAGSPAREMFDRPDAYRMLGRMMGLEKKPE